MVTGDSPAGARRRVRLAIREAREARKFTQAQVAEEMEWSLSKVMRIESGEVTITPNDLRPLLAYLGVRDGTVVDELVQDARSSRRRTMWWDEPRFRADAVPGLLQTAGYARALLQRFELNEETIEARVDARLRCRAQLYRRRCSGRSRC